jgi:hypothetical protein
MAGKPSTDVAVFDKGKYPMLDPAGMGADIAEIMAENMGDDGLSPFDLDRVKMPSGGGIAWEVPTADGPEPMKSITGVVVAWMVGRSWWERDLDDPEAGDNTPPDCAARDGKIGIGRYGTGSEENPTGECDTCPMNQWESAVKGSGKACKEQRLLYLLLPGNALPIVVALAPTSIAPWRKYVMRLTSEGIAYYSIETTLGLEKVKGNGTPDYAVVVPQRGNRLDAETAATAKAYGASLKSSFAGR